MGWISPSRNRRRAQFACENARGPIEPWRRRSRPKHMAGAVFRNATSTRAVVSLACQPEGAPEFEKINMLSTTFYVEPLLLGQASQLNLQSPWEQASPTILLRGRVGCWNGPSFSDQGQVWFNKSSEETIYKIMWYICMSILFLHTLARSIWCLVQMKCYRFTALQHTKTRSLPRVSHTTT